MSRFGPKPSEEEAGQQQDIRDKLLARLALPQFTAKTDRNLEDWANVADHQVSRYHVCVITKRGRRCPPRVWLLLLASHSEHNP